MAVEVAVEDAVAVDVAVAVGETVARGVAVTGIAIGVDRGVPAAFETAPTTRLRLLALQDQMGCAKQ